MVELTRVLTNRGEAGRWSPRSRSGMIVSSGKAHQLVGRPTQQGCATCAGVHDAPGVVGGDHRRPHRLQQRVRIGAGQLRAGRRCSPAADLGADVHYQPASQRHQLRRRRRSEQRAGSTELVDLLQQLEDDLGVLQLLLGDGKGNVDVLLPGLGGVAHGVAGHRADRAEPTLELLAQLDDPARGGGRVAGQLQRQQRELAEHGVVVRLEGQVVMHRDSQQLDLDGGLLAG